MHLEQEFAHRRTKHEAWDLRSAGGQLDIVFRAHERFGGYDQDALGWRETSSIEKTTIKTNKRNNVPNKNNKTNRHSKSARLA